MERKKLTKVKKAIGRVYPIELIQGQLGKLMIQDVKSENDQTTVVLSAEGITPYWQGESLHIEDEQGKRIVSNKMIKNEQKSNEFTMVFPALDLNKKYYFITHDFVI